MAQVTFPDNKTSILTVGPIFDVAVQAQISLGADWNTVVEFSVGISDTSVFIPSTIAPNGTLQVGQKGTLQANLVIGIR